MRARTAGYRLTGGIAVVAAAAIGLAACGGGHATPHVANLGTSHSGAGGSTGTSTTTLPTANATELVDEWAACMRSHGDPGLADPIITPTKQINIIGWNPATPGGIDGTEKGGHGNVGPGQYCRSYLAAAQNALQGGQHEAHPTQAQLVKFSECMRANGVPDFPDPDANGGLSFPVNAGGDLNPNNPVFKNSSKLCAQKAGVPGIFGGANPPGGIEFDGSGPGGAGG